ncbi:MAG TPA: Lrp/AsnC family transcriptional regulator [Patescibacteria group bacterium]|nr:Lrp/AsnC family transcriptional regulator [Patescibacteria group bacterium]
MVDEIDDKIIGILKENSRATYVEIGNSVGLSEGAVRNRVQALVDQGVIERFTVEVSLSVGVRALIMASIDPGTPTLVISETVKALSGVEKIYEVTGEYDIITVVSSYNIQGLNQTIEGIRKIEGVAKTNTIIVLRTV